MNDISVGENPTKYDLCVFVGRFQFPHCGHESVIKLAFEHANHVLVLIGSSNAPRSHRNPFTYEERADMISASLGEPPLNLYMQPIEDSTYNDNQWLLDCRRAVDFVLDDIAETEGYSVGTRKKMRVALIGYSKDHTSYYLNMFPGYDSIRAPNHKNISSTPLRNAYFSNICDMWLNDCDGHKQGDLVQDRLVPTPVRDFLIKFSKTAAYKDIREEYEYILNYKAKWMSAPFPVTMVTTDALVIQSGHILLVRRKGRPGKNLWALPGGYLAQNETIVDGMVRELVEETKIQISKEDLKRCIVAQRVFDDPHRDPRGRVITHGFRIDLPSRLTPTKITKKRIKLDDLEPVEGGDDAEFAKWFPLNEVKREMMFADHLDIIKALGGFN